MVKAKRLQQNAESRILTYFAKNGPSHMYPLHEIRSGCYIAARSTVHRAKNSLLNNGFIMLKNVESHAGKDKKIYGLTFKGLNVALLKSKSWKDIDQIARQQEKLSPLMFGKWQHFQRSGVKKIQLQKALRWLCFGAQQQGYERAQFLLRDFFMYVFVITEIEERVAWLRAIHDDPELSGWANEEEWTFLIYARTLITSFRLIRDPNPDWNEACKEFRRINRMPLNEELRETLEKELLDQLEE